LLPPETQMIDIDTPEGHQEAILYKIDKVPFLVIRAAGDDIVELLQGGG